MIRYIASLQDMMTSAADVIPHPENPNNGDVEEIMSSILRDGVYRPVIASRTTGHILAGHHLCEALQRLGAHDIPVLWLDGLDAAAERRILAKDNQIARLGRMDPAAELKLLQQIMADDPVAQFEGTGYVEYDLLRLLEEQQTGGGFRAGNPEDDFGAGSEHECPDCGHRWFGSSSPKEEF